MKRLFSLPLLAVILLGVGCTTSPAAPAPAPTPEVNRATLPVTLQPLTADDVALIKKDVAAKINPVRVNVSDAWVMPDGIDPMQVQGGLTVGDDQTIFGFVEQPNVALPLWHASGVSVFGKPYDQTWTKVNFAGVIFSSDGGKTWRKVFSIPPEIGSTDPNALTVFNPIGMYYEDTDYWLDIVDDQGAGSGEGVMVRYRSRDGVTWTRWPNCYYFVPESYFDMSKLTGAYTNYDTAPILPHNLRLYSEADPLHQQCPSYVSQLPSM